MKYGASASKTLRFPIKETVAFDTNAEKEINNLISNANMSPDEAVVSNGQGDKVLQVGVTDSEDEILAKANVPTLPGYAFLGWYYYGDSYFQNGAPLKDKWTDSAGTPTGVCIYDANGDLNTSCNYVTQVGSKYVWNGVDGASKAITKLYAMWKTSPITLVLNAHGGMNGGTFTGQEFGSYYPIPEPVRTGYTFAGYYDEEGYDNGNFTGEPVAKMNGNTMMYRTPVGGYAESSDGTANPGLKLTKSITLHAKWDPLEYTVRLWSADDSGEAQFVGELKNVQSGALLLPASGASAYALVDGKHTGFSNNGYGKLVLPSGVTTLSLSREHYDFMGWNLYDDQSWSMFTADKESKFTPNSATVDKDGLDVYAAWKIKDSFDIQYDTRSGDTNGLKTGSVFKGESYTIPDTLPTLKGYTFTGWCTAPSYGEGSTLYQPGDTISDVTKGVTLYAQWVENNTVSYNANNGAFNIALNPLAPAKGETVTLTVPGSSDAFRAGYEFAGWAKSPDATDPDYTADNNTFVMGDESVVLYAVWKPVQVGITYDAESGQDAYFTWADGNPTSFEFGSATEFSFKVDTTKAGVNTLRVAINGVSQSVPAPVADPGNADVLVYTFKVGGSVTDVQQVTVGGLTARSYNVTLVAGEGASIAGDSNVTYYVFGTGVDALPGADAVTRTGYTFDGWYGDAACTGSPVGSIGAGESGDKTFYAKWTPNRYTVKYNANDGEGAPADETCTYDTPFAVASGNGMTYGATNDVSFLGWSLDPDAVVPDFHAGDQAQNLATGEAGSNEVTLYAVWDVPNYKVSYALMGGTASGEGATANGSIEPGVVKTGTTATLSFPDMVRKGYSFVGWDTNVYGTDGTADVPSTQATYTEGGATNPSRT